MSDKSQSEAQERRFRRLIDVGTALLSELDLEVVLRSVVEAARELTSAEYAALGVLDRDRTSWSASSTWVSTTRPNARSAVSPEGGGSSGS